jgi:LmbE family N-acetylglucosaminyl deacetylase
MMTSLPEERVRFVSAHLDDAALSCGHYLDGHPGATVITVMAGAPEIERTNDWNSWTTGKTYAPDAVQMRRAEDAAAMRRLRAEPVWLDLWDNQYLDGQSRDELAVRNALEAALTTLGVEAIVGPVGIVHPDHVQVSDACLEVARKLSCELFYYLDMPYAQKYPEEAAARLAEIAGRGVELSALGPVQPRRNAKRRAVRLYRSQCDKMGYDKMKNVMTAPEHYWRVHVS